MSDFTAVGAVTESLLGILQDGVTNSADPQLNGVPIDLRSPKEMREDNHATRISFWLYRITRDPGLLNNRPERPSPNQLKRIGLPILLYYFVLSYPSLRTGRPSLVVSSSSSITIFVVLRTIPFVSFGPIGIGLR
jgi:hypothetical protein